MPHLLINTHHFHSFQSHFVFLEKNAFHTSCEEGLRGWWEKGSSSARAFESTKWVLNIEKYFIPLMQYTLLRIRFGYLNPGEGNKLGCLLPKPLSCFPFCCRTPRVSSALLPVFVENLPLFAVENVLAKLWWSRALCAISEFIWNACSFTAGWWWWWFLC